MDVQKQQQLPQVTDKIYLDIGVCEQALNNNRLMGDLKAYCNDPSPVGRLVIGLYGSAAPSTVNVVKQAINQNVYKDTLAQKIIPGEYVLFGKQGAKRYGYIGNTSKVQLDSNTDLTKSEAFQISHNKPGTVSLCVLENDDEDYVKENRDYKNLEFMITLGPSPVPRLDGANIVFGQIVDGFDVLDQLGKVPSINPGDNLRSINQLATFFGDKRAGGAKKVWGKPLKAIVITGAGVLA